jgi:ATP-dependent DNA helicase DinG
LSVSTATRPGLTLPPAAAERIRREIRRARGNEVCFLAAVGENGEILEPRVVARGHSNAVLAAIRDPEPGGVVLHNHPSGVLDPSAPDLAVAAQLWEQGLGFAIVDNDATELYVVVEPPEAHDAQSLDLDEVEVDLAPGGAVSRLHSGYEDRPQQRALARMIGELYNNGGVGIAEAGTGTGKSVAYLLPAIRWAVLNRERTVVSTNTINLQEQLVGKDLPFLRRALGLDFRYTLVKGRQNYVSIRRALLAQENAPSLFPDGRASEMDAIASWLATTKDGSLSDLSFRPASDVWDEVASDSDVCLRQRCPHFTDCFYQRARREAASADVLVVNHHLLFSDLAVRRELGNFSAPAVLPHYRRLVLDEAHNLEETATRHLGSSVSRRGLFRALRRLEHRGKGTLPTLIASLGRSRHDLLAQSTLDLIEQRLLPELESARDRATALFTFLESVFPRGEETMVRLDRFADDPAWEAGLSEALDGLLQNLESLLRGLETLRDRIGADEQAKVEMEAQLLEVRGASNRIAAAAHALRSALRPGRDAVPMVRWMERRRERANPGAPPSTNVLLSAAPLDPGGQLRETIFERVPTVVLTSATLSTGGDFAFMRERLGLRAVDEVREAMFPSPFDFETQSLLAVPLDVPVPAGATAARHDEATVRATLELARITDGGIFVLFTSYRALLHVARELRVRGADREWPLFVQGESLSRAELVARFAESGRGVLLGTTSFWEGVDVPGDPLRGLLIPKLPFKVPSEPVTAARIEAIEAAGGNSFASFMLPHAAIRLKQGFGRLIRSRSDRGAVVVLDPRIARKAYGRYLVASLPPAPPIVAPWRDVEAALMEFYGAPGSRARARGVLV